MNKKRSKHTKSGKISPMKKAIYFRLSLLILTIYGLSVWFNPIIFTNLKFGLLVLGVLISMWLLKIYSRRRKVYPIHIVMLVLALLITAANIYVFVNVHNILNPIQLETTQISVFVLKENEDLEFNKNLEIGVSLEIEPTMYEELLTHIEDDLGFILSPDLEANDNDLIRALYSNDIPAIMIDVANLGFLEVDAAREFLDKTVVIYSYEKTNEVIDRDSVIDDIESNSIVFYISGIDHLGDLNTRSRSDVNQLAIVNPDTRKISLVSLPRDTYVPTTCLNNVSDKLSHAGVRGIQCSIGTIEQYLKIPVDHYVRLNFSSFISIFDIIGPTEIYSHYTFSSYGFDYKKGMNLMDAEKALMFARSRYEVPGGDLTRGLHQQEIIKGVFKKLTSPSQIKNIQKVINSTRKFVQTDVTAGVITDLLDLHFSSTKGWEIESHVLSGENGWASWPNDSERKYSVILHSEEQLEEYRQLMDDLRRIAE